MGVDLAPTVSPWLGGSNASRVDEPSAPRITCSQLGSEPEGFPREAPRDNQTPTSAQGQRGIFRACCLPRVRSLRAITRGAPHQLSTPPSSPARGHAAPSSPCKKTALTAASASRQYSSLPGSPLKSNSRPWHMRHARGTNASASANTRATCLRQRVGRRVRGEKARVACSGTSSRRSSGCESLATPALEITCDGWGGGERSRLSRAPTGLASDSSRLGGSSQSRLRPGTFPSRAPSRVRGVRTPRAPSGGRRLRLTSPVPTCSSQTTSLPTLRSHTSPSDPALVGRARYGRSPCLGFMARPPP